MNKTNISWTDFSSSPVKYRDQNGKSVWACVKCSTGCANCFSESLAKRWGRGGPFSPPVMKTLTPYVDEHELHHLLHAPKLTGQRVFMEDMSDLFGEWVPFAMIDRVFAAMALRPDVTFQLLTKRPERMAEYLTDQTLRVVNGSMCGSRHETIVTTCQMITIDPNRLSTPIYWPLPNVWLGASIENQKAADERIPAIIRCPAAVKFLSVEPMLGSVSLAPWTADWFDDRAPKWCIIGGESGPNARPMEIDWLRALVAECRESKIAVWVKQDSHRLPGQQGRIPDDLWVHEMPTDAVGQNNMRVYISGPMSGIDRHNYPAFHAAAARIRARGYECVNPAEVNPESEILGGNLPTDELWRVCMKRDLPQLLGCDAIAVLPGWEKSRGARLEVYVAVALGMSVINEAKWTLEPVPD